MKKTTKDERLPLRQGDVLLVPIQTPADAELAPAPKDKRGIVLAEGETSFHHHWVFGRGAKLAHFRDSARVTKVLFVGRDGADLRVVGGGAGGVDRHESVNERAKKLGVDGLTPGAWEVRTQRQYTAEDELRSRAVAD